MIDLPKIFRREREKRPLMWTVLIALAITFPLANNGAPYNPDAGRPDTSDRVFRAVERCQSGIRAQWRYAQPVAGAAETIEESDRVIVKQPFTIGALRDDAICDVSHSGIIEVTR
jgi:hypothetical protein